MSVVIVGAGPSGSTAAYYLARAGIDVTVLEKTRFPREKVCGDALTPRAVREIQRIGLPHEESEGWRRLKGLRLVASGNQMELPWPELTDFPDYGLIRTRLGFDEALARHAQAAGTKILEGHSVSETLTDESGRVTGVRANILDEAGRKSGETLEVSGAVVLAADGNSSRSAVSRGFEKRDDRPMGVAYRTYYRSPRHLDDWMEGWLELPGKNGDPLPGYGWVFGVGDGTSNVGLGILNSSKEFGKLDYRQVLKEWTAGMPEEWGFTEENQQDRILGAALPMAFNRTPHYSPGFMLLGDAGGMVSPFNGEGISYAMESGRMAAEAIINALKAPTKDATEKEFARYADIIKDEWGSHFTQGRLFAQIIGNPHIMRLALKLGFSSEVLMNMVVRLLANLSDEVPRTIEDRVIHVLERLTPATDNQNSARTLSISSHNARRPLDLVRALAPNSKSDKS